MPNSGLRRHVFQTFFHLFCLLRQNFACRAKCFCLRRLASPLGNSTQNSVSNTGSYPWSITPTRFTVSLISFLLELFRAFSRACVWSTLIHTNKSMHIYVHHIDMMSRHDGQIANLLHPLPDIANVKKLHGPGFCVFLWMYTSFNMWLDSPYQLSYTHLTHTTCMWYQSVLSIHVNTHTRRHIPSHSLPRSHPH